MEKKNNKKNNGRFRFSQEVMHKSIRVTETFTLTDLFPNNKYYIWLAAKSRRGEGASTPPLEITTQEYGEDDRDGHDFHLQLFTKFNLSFKESKNFLRLF